MSTHTTTLTPPQSDQPLGPKTVPPTESRPGPCERPALANLFVTVMRFVAMRLWVFARR